MILNLTNLMINLSSLGKQYRYRRLIDPETQAIIAVPMDHGYTLGPIKGIKDIKFTTNEVLGAGASCVVVQKGIVRAISDIPASKGLMIHISGSVSFSPHANEKILTGSVEDAVFLGADGVSCHINVGADNDKNMLADFAKITSKADKFGMPVLAMMYVRDSKGNDTVDPEALAHAARIAEETGADIVKINATIDGKGFDEVVQGITIPVVIAGGGKTDMSNLLKTIENCILAGAQGVSIGRNIFQSDQIRETTKKVVDTVNRAIKAR
jgi:predicted phospho-2-dehydro-3-deoxyheptonate aldolase